MWCSTRHRHFCAWFGLWSTQGCIGCCCGGAAACVVPLWLQPLSLSTGEEMNKVQSAYCCLPVCVLRRSHLQGTCATGWLILTAPAAAQLQNSCTTAAQLQNSCTNAAQLQNSCTKVAAPALLVALCQCCVRGAVERPVLSELCCAARSVCESPSAFLVCGDLSRNALLACCPVGSL